MTYPPILGSENPNFTFLELSGYVLRFSEAILRSESPEFSRVSLGHESYGNTPKREFGKKNDFQKSIQEYVMKVGESEKPVFTSF